MKINQKKNADTLTVTVEGRLDTTTAPELETYLKSAMGDCDKLVLDFSGLDYISSAGLRVLLTAHKAMMSKGGMTVTGVNAIVSEIFEVTGFSDILNIA